MARERRRRAATSAILLGGLCSSRAALSVLPQQSDGIVTQLRASILVDEKDLFGPLPLTSCSSMEDGPFCLAFGDAPFSTQWDGPSKVGVRILASGDTSMSSSRSVMDGVISHRLQGRNKEAFDWNPDTYRTFSQLVSRVIADTVQSAGKAAAGSAASPSAARSGTKCYRLDLRQLEPWLYRVPIHFSAGLPSFAAPYWAGDWAIEPGLVPRLKLRTEVGYIRFLQPVVLKSFLIGVPTEIPAGLEPTESWGATGLVCGRLQGVEKWCTSLEEALALPTSPDALGESWVRFVDVGHSLLAIDEVALLALPLSGLSVGGLELQATSVKHKLHEDVPAHRRAVLLRRPTANRASRRMEPVMVTVSKDAATWNLNEVLEQNMRLRNPAENLRPVPPRSTKVAAKPTVRHFLEMLRDLKSGHLQQPSGVSMSQLKREMSTLVASTKEIQDDDVLVHSKIETLLQQRVREKGLDGLLSLQARWQRQQPAVEQSPEDTAPPEAAAVPDGVNMPVEVPEPAPSPTDSLPSLDEADAMDPTLVEEAMERASQEMQERSQEMQERQEKFKKKFGPVKVFTMNQNGELQTQPLGEDGESEEGDTQETLESQFSEMFGEAIDSDASKDMASKLMRMVSQMAGGGSETGDVQFEMVDFSELMGGDGSNGADATDLDAAQSLQEKLAEMFGNMMPEESTEEHDESDEEASEEQAQEESGDLDAEEEEDSDTDDNTQEGKPKTKRKKKDVKVQVQFINMNGDANMAEMMQSMLNGQDAAGMDGAGMEGMQEAMQDALRQAFGETLFDAGTGDREEEDEDADVDVVNM